MKPTIKQARALAVLRLLGRGKSIQEMSQELGHPESTIRKHISAFKHLTGKEGHYAQEEAFNSLFHTRLGISQREVARDLFCKHDHKFISDLCAMDWAIRSMLGNINMEAITAMIERGVLAEKQDRTFIREPISVLSEAFDDMLMHLPDDMSPDLEDAITYLTEAIIEVEELLHH